MIISGSIHVAANGISSLFWLPSMGSHRVGHDGSNAAAAAECSVVYMYHDFFIHCSADGHLGGFHLLAIVKSAAMNTGVQGSFSISILSIYMPRSGIAGSFGISIFSFLRNFHNILHRTFFAKAVIAKKKQKKTTHADNTLTKKNPKCLTRKYESQNNNVA